MQMKSGGHEEPQPSEQPSTEQRTAAMRSSTSGSVTTCSLRPAARSTPPHLLDMPLVLIISQSSAAGAKQQQPEQQHMAAAMRGGSSGLSIPPTSAAIHRPLSARLSPTRRC